jgi:adenine/guanine/hypoxanthine permease
VSNALSNCFGFEQAGPTCSREVIAGATTFVTTSHIVGVNPAVLKGAGIPAESSMVPTILTAIFGTLLMGVYAHRPFAIAPYMGENAFTTYTVAQVLGFRWQIALAAVFVAGAIFLLLTVLSLRQRLVEAVPPYLRYRFAIGIGLFLTFIGFNQTGIVLLGHAAVPVRTGHLTSAPVLVAIAGLLLMAALIVRRFPAAILTAILATAFLAYATGVAKAPQAWVSLPPSLSPILFRLDFSSVLTWGFFPVVLTIFIMAFVDTVGTLIGISAGAGFLDEHGNLPSIEKPMTADAVSMMFAAAVSTSTARVFIESAAGVEAGGGMGLTAVVTALGFAGTLLFSPFIAAIPAQAFGPALIVVGILMLSLVTKIPFHDFTELIAAFAVVTLISFTYNVAVGITAGFILFPFCKLVSGRPREVNPWLCVLAAISLLFLCFTLTHDAAPTCGNKECGATFVQDRV